MATATLSAGLILKYFVSMYLFSWILLLFAMVIVYCLYSQQVNRHIVDASHVFLENEVIAERLDTVEAPLPIVITVNGSAAPCRPRNAKLVQKYKRALGAQEKAAITKEGAELAYAGLYEKYPYLNITEWSVADVNGDLAQCGLSGSPTKVKTIQNISFQAKESKTLTGSDKDVEDLIVELLANHTIG